MDVSELAALQKNITEELMNQMNVLHDRISLEQRCSQMMFGLIISELEKHAPEVRAAMNCQIDDICSTLDDPLTTVAAGLLRSAIGDS